MSLYKTALDTAALGADAVATIARTGVIRPVLPRRAALGVLLATPWRGVGLGTAVALHAALRPDDVALVDDRGPLTWRELDDRVNRLARTFLAGSARSRRVAFLLRNGREAVECYLACFRAGLSAVPVNTWSPAADVARVLSAQHPATVVYAEEFADKIDWTGWGGQTLVTGPGETYEQALAAARSEPPRVRGGGHVVTYTSGTTGGPKGAERHLSPSVALVGLRLLQKVPIRATDRFLIGPPLFHMLAQGMLTASLALGCTVVLRERSDPLELLTAIRTEDVTALCVVPIMLRRMLDAAEPHRAGSLRLIVVSGSAFPVTLRDRAHEVFGPITYDLYGSTEAGWATISTPHDHAERPGSVGRTGRGMQIEILDDEGNPLPPGEEGRITVRTGLEFLGYSEVGPRGDGSLDLGDRGLVDVDGYLFVTGRGDDMVVIGGENVQPADVEAVLDTQPGVVETAVVGVDDEEYGQVLAAFVVTEDGAGVSADDVVAFARAHLARYQVPRRVTLVDELPRNAAGKVVKRRLLPEEPPLPT